MSCLTRAPAGANAGFSLLELLIAVVVLVAIAAIAIPIYRGYVTTAEDGALLSQMRAMSIFQEDTRLRTGSYGSGVFDAAAGVNTLTAAIGWQAAANDDVAYSVVANAGVSWTVAARKPSGRSLCRVFPANAPCP